MKMHAPRSHAMMALVIAGAAAVSAASAAPLGAGNRRQESGGGGPAPSTAPIDSTLDPAPGPEESLAPMLAALAARDERLRHVSWSFRVEPRFVREGVPAMLCEGRLEHSGHRRRLELKWHEGHRDERLTWDGSRCAGAIRDWDDSGQCRFEIGSDPGARFRAAFFPNDVGTHANGQPLGDDLRSAVRAWDGGRIEHEGASLRVVFTGNWFPAADGTVTPRPQRRHLIDDRKTLLAMRSEVLTPADSGEAIATAPAVELRGELFRVLYVTAVREVGRVEDVHFATVVDIDYPGDPPEDRFPLRITIDPAASSLAEPTDPARFELRNDDRYPVHDLDTGVIQKRDAPGAMAGQVDRMARDLAAELGRPVPDGMAPDATQWRTPSCGALAAYLLLRLEGGAAELDAVIDAIGAEGATTSVAEIAACLERGGVAVQALAADWRGLARLAGPFIVHLQREEDGTEGHFTLATLRDGRLRLHDPRATFAADEGWFETVAGGEVAVIVPRRAIPAEAEGGRGEIVILAIAGGLCLAASLLAGRRRPRVPASAAVATRRGSATAAMVWLAIAPSCAESPSVAPSPLVVVGAASVDAGSVDPRSPLLQVFRLRNTTAQPIALDAMAKSCGCTDVVVEPSIVPPFGEAQARVTVDMSGQWRRDVTVRLASSARADVAPLQLRVRATSRVANELVVRPRVLDFGELTVGSGAVREFEATSRGAVASTAARLVEAPSWVEVVIGEPRDAGRDARGACVRTWRVQVHIIAGFAIEPRRDGQLVVTLADGSAARVALTTAMATVGDFRARPARLFATALGEARLSRSIALERVGASRAALAGARCDIAGVTVALAAEPATSLAVEVDPTRLPADPIVNGTIRVDWTGGATDGLDIPLALLR